MAKNHGEFVASKKDRMAALAIKYANNAAGYAADGQVKRAKILLLDTEHNLVRLGIENREDVQEALRAAWEVVEEYD